MMARPATNDPVAMRQWMANNSVLPSSPTDDAFWKFDKVMDDALYKEKPWKHEPRYYRNVYLSAVALVKMLIHAKTGKGKQGLISGSSDNWIEVMGVLLGFWKPNAVVITDSFALPVNANEVECSMSPETMAYMTGYQQHCRDLGREDSGMIAWYHSHPGYSCFLSGIDVNTQTNYQNYQHTAVALVIDPVRTISTGKAEVKAFRVFPEGYTGTDHFGNQNNGGGEGGMEGVPLDRMKESGFHAHRYYEVPITIFRSSTDGVVLSALWNKYWAQTLASNPLSVNRVFFDSRLEVLSARLAKAEKSLDTAHYTRVWRDFAEDTKLHGVAGGANNGANNSGVAAAGTGRKLRSDGAGAVEFVRSSTTMMQEVLGGVLMMLVKESAFNKQADRRQ